MAEDKDDDPQISRRNAHGRVGEDFKYQFRQVARAGSYDGFLALAKAWNLEGERLELATRAFWELVRALRG